MRCGYLPLALVFAAAIGSSAQSIGVVAGVFQSQDDGDEASLESGGELVNDGNPMKDDDVPQDNTSGSVASCRFMPDPPSEQCGFVCPENACVIPGNNCVDGLKDCLCQEGWLMQDGLCVPNIGFCLAQQYPPKPGCRFECPTGACANPDAACVDSMEKCICQQGLMAHEGHCWESSSGAPATATPACMDGYVQEEGACVQSLIRFGA